MLQLIISVCSIDLKAEMLTSTYACLQGKWQEAVEHYTEALSANWEDVALWNNRSLAFMKLNQVLTCAEH